MTAATNIGHSAAECGDAIRSAIKPTHRLMGVEVYGLTAAASPWSNDTAPWSTATRRDNGVQVLAPTFYFIAVVQR